MIIRGTVNDNDFSESLEAFAKSLNSRMLGLVNCVPADASVDVKIQAHRDWQRIFDLINPNCTNKDNFSDDDRSFIISKVTQAWKNFVKHWHVDQEDDRDYLINNFECTVSFNFTEMWENGEAVYYFTTAQTAICQ